jgi:hypothetical protein
MRHGTAFRVSHLGALPEHPLPERSSKRQKIRDLSVIDDFQDEREAVAAGKGQWLGEDDGDNESMGREETHGDNPQEEEGYSFQRLFSPELGENVPSLQSVSARHSEAADVQIMGSSQLSPGQRNGFLEPQVKDEQFSPTFGCVPEAAFQSPPPAQRLVSSSIESASRRGSVRPRYRPSPVAAPPRYKTGLESGSVVKRAPKRTASRNKKDVYDFPSSDDNREFQEPTPRSLNRLLRSKKPNGVGLVDGSIPPSPSTQLENEFTRSSQDCVVRGNAGLQEMTVQQTEEARLENERIDQEAKARAAAEREEQEQRDRKAREGAAKEARLRAAKAAEEREKIERGRREKSEMNRLVREEEELLAKENKERELAEKKKEQEEKKRKAEAAKEAKKKAQEEEMKRKAEAEEKKWRVEEMKQKQKNAKDAKAQKALEAKNQLEKEKAEKAREAKEQREREATGKARELEEKKAKVEKEVEQKKQEKRQKEEASKATKSEALTTKKRTRSESTASVDSKMSPTTNGTKKLRTQSPPGKEGQTKGTPSVERDMGPPPVPSSAMKRSNLKKDSSSQDSASGKQRHSVSFAEDPLSSEISSTPTPSARPPPAKQTPIVCPLPVKLKAATPKNVTPIQPLNLVKSGVAPVDTKQPKSEKKKESVSESGSESESESESGSESEDEAACSESEDEAASQTLPAPKQITAPKAAARTNTIAKPVGNLGNQAANRKVKKPPPSGISPSEKSNEALSDVDAGSDIEMGDASATASLKPSPSGLSLPKHSTTINKTRPIVSSDSELDSSSNKDEVPLPALKKGFKPGASLQSQKPSKPTQPAKPLPKSTQPEGSESEFEYETGSEEESDEDEAALKTASALNSLMGIPKAPISSITTEVVPKLSMLESLDEDVSFDVRDIHTPSSQQLSQSSQPMSLSKKAAKGDDSESSPEDEGSSESESESESESDSDSGSSGDDESDQESNAKSKANGGIPDHKKAGSIKKKAPNAMGFGRRFPGVC